MRYECPHVDAEEEVWLDMVGLESASAAIEVVQKELEVVGGGGQDAQGLTGFGLR